MPKQNIDLQRLLDRAAIHDVIARYFRGIDRGDADMMRSCFTEDVEASFSGRPLARGIDEVMAGVPTFRKVESGEWKVITHFMGNLNIDFPGPDVAAAETNAFAFQVVTRAPTDQVSMRSLRYLDRLRRVKDGWLISDRLHTLDWSCEVPATFAVTVAQRVTAWPLRTP